MPLSNDPSKRGKQLANSARPRCRRGNEPTGASTAAMLGSPRASLSPRPAKCSMRSPWMPQSGTQTAPCRHDTIACGSSPRFIRRDRVSPRSCARIGVRQGGRGVRGIVEYGLQAGRSGARLMKELGMTPAAGPSSGSTWRGRSARSRTRSRRAARRGTRSTAGRRNDHDHQPQELRENGSPRSAWGAPPPWRRDFWNGVWV